VSASSCSRPPTAAARERSERLVRSYRVVATLIAEQSAHVVPISEQKSATFLRHVDCSFQHGREAHSFDTGGIDMARRTRRRRYSPSASRDVASALRRRKRGTLRSGKGGKGGRVTSRKQAIAIALSEARKKGKKVPRRRS
jgi:hypothetical protein